MEITAPSSKDWSALKSLEVQALIHATVERTQFVPDMDKLVDDCVIYV